MSDLRTSVKDYRLPLTHPFRTGAGSTEERRGFLVRIRDGETCGFGEAAPLPGRTESRRDCRRALRAGLRVLRSDGYDLAMEILDETPAARHGVNLAWLDLRARREECPLYGLLSPDQTVKRLPVNGLIGEGPIDSTMARVRRLLEAGFRTLKVKVGERPLSEDLERVGRITTSLPDDARLRLDVNGRWTLRQSLDALNRLPVERIEYLEQPLAPENLTEHQQLRQHVDVALDESLGSFSPEEILNQEAADVLVLKPMCLGGIDRVLSVRTRARQHGVDTVVTTSLDAVVGRLGCVHLAAGFDPSRPQGLATAGLFERDLDTDPAPVEGGSLRVPQSPGLGTNGGWGSRP